MLDQLSFPGGEIRLCWTSPPFLRDKLRFARVSFPGFCSISFPLGEQIHRQQLAGRRQKVELHNHRVSDIAENIFLKSETSGSTRSNFYEDILRAPLFPRSRNFFVDETEFRDNKAGRSLSTHHWLNAHICMPSKAQDRSKKAQDRRMRRPH